MKKEADSGILAAQALRAGTDEKLVLALINEKPAEEVAGQAKHKKSRSKILAIFVIVGLFLYVALYEPFGAVVGMQRILGVGFIGLLVLLMSGSVHGLPRHWLARNYRQGNQYRAYPRVVLTILGWSMICVSVISALFLLIV